MSKIVPISFHAVFQFHYGTIKSQSENEIAKGLISFNSTMVRLKELSNVEVQIFRKFFQFHYGTIKS